MIEPTIESLLAQSGKTGWDFFAPPAAPGNDGVVQAMTDKRGQRAAVLASALFGTDAGKELLEFLADQTMRRVTFMTQLGIDPQQALAYGAFREGQNALFFSILKLIAEGQKAASPQERDQ